MTEVYIYDAVRTPRGKGSAKSGALKDVKPIDLLVQLYTALEQRNDLDTTQIESVILGCVGQYGDQGANIAKISTVAQGWPEKIDAMTVNTFCSSGLTAISIAMSKIVSGMASLTIAGGIEMMSRVPMFADKGAWFADPDIVERTHYTHMGVAADLIATLEGHNRADLEAYAVQSHQRAASATERGRFNASLIPVVNGQGDVVLSHDECVRGSSTVEGMQSLEPLFETYTTDSIRKKMHERYPKLASLQHHHHVGTSPAMADGACLLLIGNAEIGKTLGLTPRARIVSYDSTACEPIIMLLGGQLSMQNAVKKAGLTMSDIDLHNFAEAFASTCLKYQRDHEIDPDKFNVNGCTMTMGHAQGSSGGMITTTLLDEMELRDVCYGVAGISGGAGLGAGIVIER